VEGGIEAGDLRDIRRERGDGVDGGEVVGLVRTGRSYFTPPCTTRWPAATTRLPRRPSERPQESRKSVASRWVMAAALLSQVLWAMLSPREPKARKTGAVASASIWPRSRSSGGLPGLNT
jgi:hypothetical protein